MQFKEIAKKPLILKCYFCGGELTENDKTIYIHIRVKGRLFKNRCMCNACAIINDTTAIADSTQSIENMTLLRKTRKDPELSK